MADSSVIIAGIIASIFVVALNFCVWGGIIWAIQSGNQWPYYILIGGISAVGLLMFTGLICCGVQNYGTTRSSKED